MKTLFNIILKYHFFLLFVLLETISISIVISSDIERKIVFFSSANALSGFFNKRTSEISSYFSLAQTNNQLKNENIRLKNDLLRLKSLEDNSDYRMVDSIGSYRFEYIAAKVINNTVSKDKNFITLDKGEIHGVEKDFGVIGPDGVAGRIIAVSKRYSLAVSLLNTEMGISGKIKRNNYFGSIQWQGDDYRFSKMYEIPNHLKISIGDTIVTSGFSAVFPEGIDIGTIARVDKNVSNNFFDIDIELLTDFKSLYHVYIVNNKNYKEKVLLENSLKNEY
jgi:rod shape-determining protein MreC